MLYLKHHAYKSSWIRNNVNLISMNNHTVHYKIINIPYNLPAFLAASCLNIGYMSSYALIRIRY